MKKESSVFALCCVVFSLCGPLSAQASFRIVTTTPDIRSLVLIVTAKNGAPDPEFDVDSIAKGTQDPHFIEAKPSFMVKANRADLVISTGLELEEGWLPSIVQGARNPKINPGTAGFLELGASLDPLEIPQKGVTRADGDVHPSGNPHVFLDPIRAGKAAQLIAESLSKSKPAEAARFKANATQFESLMREKTKNWSERIKKTGISQIVTYHKTLTYFLDRFGIKNPAILEPKPGIPPTSAHIIDVIQIMKKEKIQLVLIENYFDSTASKKIETEIPGVRVKTVPVAVDGNGEVKSLVDLYEYLVKIIEGK